MELRSWRSIGGACEAGWSYMLEAQLPTVTIVTLLGGKADGQLALLTDELPGDQIYAPRLRLDFASGPPARRDGKEVDFDDLVNVLGGHSAGSQGDEE